MRRQLDRQVATGWSGLAAAGVAQEFQRAWPAYRRVIATAAPQFSFRQGRPPGYLLLPAQKS